jgi:histone deacetylase complex regulatory component SIN3
MAEDNAPLSPLPHNAPSLTMETPESSFSSGSSTLLRPLNVKDALAYLDEIKKSTQEPQVYHSFINIMSDFKRSVSTPPQVF